MAEFVLHGCPHTSQVDGVDAVEQVGWFVGGVGGWCLDAGVVECHVEAPEGGDGAVDHRRDLCLVGHVAGDSEHLMPGRLEVVGGGVEFGFVVGGEHDGGAGLGEGASGGEAHAGAGAGDEGDLAGEVVDGVHRGLLLRVVGSDGEEGLDGASFVHRPVAVGDLVERECEVEDLAGVDGAVRDQVDELGQESAHGGGAAVEVGVAEEQLIAGEVAVGDADVADVAAGADRSDGLQHRFAGADGLDDRVHAQPVGEVLDAGDAVVAAFFDDVGGAELAGELLAGLVAAHDDDPLGAELSGGEHTEETDGAVTDDGDGLAWADLGGDRAEPARAEHIRCGEVAGDQIR